MELPLAARLDLAVDADHAFLDQILGLAAGSSQAYELEVLSKANGLRFVHRLISILLATCRA
jgi:hypothetical protein